VIHCENYIFSCHTRNSRSESCVSANQSHGTYKFESKFGSCLFTWFKFNVEKWCPFSFDVVSWEND